MFEEVELGLGFRRLGELLAHDDLLAAGGEEDARELEGVVRGHGRGEIVGPLGEVDGDFVRLLLAAKKIWVAGVAK